MDNQQDQTEQQPVRSVRAWRFLIIVAAVVCIGYLLTRPINKVADTGPRHIDKLQQARDQGKPLYVEFYANWCAPCKVFEKRILNTPAGKELLDRFVVVRVDVDAQGSLARSFGVETIPFHVVLDPSSDPPRIVGRLEGLPTLKQFALFLESAKSKTTTKPQE